ncbi:hypothetical protein D3C72_247300 [compost metagenome]
MNKLQEIREALAGATPGPWEYEIYDDMADIYPVKGPHNPICQTWTKTEEPMQNSENNARLIAHTPEYLSYLLQLVETQWEALEEMREQIPIIQDNLESPNVRHNAANMIEYKIQQALGTL